MAAFSLRRPQRVDLVGWHKKKRLMKGVLLFLLAGVGLVGAQGEPVPERTVSNTGQFVIHGSSLAVRNSVGSLAEDVQEILRKVVGEGPVFGEDERQGWQFPIVVQLHEESDKPMRAEFGILDAGFRLQLDVHLSRGINRAALERKLLELLLYERGLRGRGPDSVPNRILVPPWLVDGLGEAIRWRRQTANRELYQVLFERGVVLPVAEVLELEKVDDLDGASRASFRVSAGALVMGLLAQKGGKEAMGEMLAATATFEGDASTLLRNHFPGMNLGEKSLAKWWALQLARMAEPDILSTLTISETDRQLSEILVLKVVLGDGPGETFDIHPEHYRDLLVVPHDVRRKAMEGAVSRANTFYLKAFPAYRPIIEGYLQILSELARDLDEEVDVRLSDLAADRQTMVARGSRLFDMLNWYAIGTAYEVSGAFDDYQELKRGLSEERQRKRGAGPVSRYLDRVEVLFAQD